VVLGCQHRIPRARGPEERCPLPGVPRLRLALKVRCKVPVFARAPHRLVMRLRVASPAFMPQAARALRRARFARAVDAAGHGRRDETCPVSTGGGTRRVQSVREGGGGGGIAADAPAGGDLRGRANDRHGVAVPLAAEGVYSRDMVRGNSREGGGVAMVLPHHSPHTGRC